MFAKETWRDRRFNKGKDRGVFVTPRGPLFYGFAVFLGSAVLRCLGRISRVELQLPGRMEHHFQRCDQPVGTTAVDELPATAGHRLPLERLGEQVLHRLP